MQSLLTRSSKACALPFQRLLSQSCVTKTHKNSLPILTLFTKEDCTLCDDAKEVLKPYMHLVNFEEVNITDEGNEHYFKKFRYDIPVFHLDGRYLMKHRANIDTLLERIKMSEKKN